MNGLLMIAAAMSALLTSHPGATQPGKVIRSAPIVRVQRDMRSWRYMPYSTSVIIAHDLRLGLIRPAFNARRPFNPNLTCSGPPCVFPNSEASGGGQPANENPMAVNPKKTTEIMSGANDYNCPLIQGSYNSNDGGTTWTRSCMTLAAGGSGGDGDPIVAYDLKGNAYRGGIDVASGGSEIGVSVSKNNGKTWGTAVVADPVYFSGGLDDKPWMEIDTNRGKGSNAIYISATEFNSSNDSQISMSYSTDGGKKWKTDAVSALATYPNVNQFSDVAIDNKGTVYVSWMNCTANGSTGDCGGTAATEMISKSKDGGKTWSTPVTIQTVQLAPDSSGCFYGCLPNTGERVANIPTIAFDNSKKGKVGNLYVVDYTYTGAYMQVQVTTSKDGGATWGTPVPVAPNTDTNDQAMPWLNVASDGTVGVSWLDRRNDPNNVNYESFGAYSSDGGKTFPNNYDLSAAPSNPFNDGFGGGFFGDYSGNGWAGEALYVTYPDTTNGTNAQDFLGGFLLP